MGFEQDLTSGAKNTYEAAKTVIKSPVNVDWKKQGVVGGIADATGNAVVNTVGQTVKLASLGAGYVLGKARNMAFSSIKNVVGIGIGLAKNIPLPMPGGGTVNGFDIQKLGPTALNDRLNRKPLQLWNTPDSPPASSPAPDVAKT